MTHNMYKSIAESLPSLEHRSNPSILQTEAVADIREIEQSWSHGQRAESAGKHLHCHGERPIAQSVSITVSSHFHCSQGQSEVASLLQNEMELKADGLSVQEGLNQGSIVL